MRDHDTYYPVRDGKRHYAAVWCVDTMRRFLPDHHVDLAKRLQAMQQGLHTGQSIQHMERVDGGKGASERDERLLQRGEDIRTLYGFEAAARTRVGRDAELCFRGIVEGDSQKELALRVGYPPGSVRSLRRLVQITLDALSAYEEENDAQAARSNGYGR